MDASGTSSPWQHRTSTQSAQVLKVHFNFQFKTKLQKVNTQSKHVSVNTGVNCVINGKHPVEKKNLLLVTIQMFMSF